MTADYSTQFSAGLILLALTSFLAIGLFAAVLVFLYVQNWRRSKLLEKAMGLAEATAPAPAFPMPVSSPEAHFRWAVIKSTDPAAVQAALGLHNPTPCSWHDGLARWSTQKLFISAPIRGWIVIFGSGLVDPAEDPDHCFHFLVTLSRALGQVQLFSVNRSLNHHGWVRACDGEIQRAYVWAGETLWNQGPLTSPENELAVRCFNYAEQPPSGEAELEAAVAWNTSQVKALAERWSLDPSGIDDSLSRLGLGVAGDVTQSKRSRI